MTVCEAWSKKNARAEIALLPQNQRDGGARPRWRRTTRWLLSRWRRGCRSSWSAAPHAACKFL